MTEHADNLSAQERALRRIAAASGSKQKVDSQGRHVGPRTIYRHDEAGFLTSIEQEPDGDSAA